MASNVMSIGFSANTPFSIVIIDIEGVVQPNQVLNSDQLFLCFDLAELKQAPHQLGLSLPRKIIDLKVELCLLDNIIKKRTSTEVSCFHSALNEMVLDHQIDTIAPDGRIWSHPCLQINHQAESTALALRHARWMMKLWEKYQSKINIGQALHRSLYCHYINQISELGFPIDLAAIKQPTSEDEVNFSRELLKVISKGRCFSPVKAYAATTGRNSTSSKHYPLSIKASLRKWIKPAKNRCFIHLDFHRQEIGAAAALSKDSNLVELYLNGDPYQWFANQCNPPIELKKAKHLFIAFQYGARPSEELSRKISIPKITVEHLHKLHQVTFQQYWSWTDLVIEDAFADGYLALSDGWQVKATNKSSLLSVINWPIQATCAQLLRNVVCELGEQNILPIGLNHDAVLLECACDEANELANKTKAVMQEASRQLLGLELSVSVDIGLSGQSLLSVLEKIKYE